MWLVLMTQSMIFKLWKVQLMLQVKPKPLNKESILEIIQGIFPNTTVMFVYYCGSLAFGLNDENSDDDVTGVQTCALPI